ncbi:glycosyltransferase [Sphingomonas pokkalii]|uniref:glycosyltransferase n=1 Tax=Sphingomonas pokkalii TaxID=2175090 RepID=UPI001057E712|nr:glycosyltransferase [Sphingomonas pokkalii]
MTSRLDWRCLSDVSDENVRALRESGSFDAEWYLREYPDVAQSGVDPARHYLWLGERLGRSPSPRSQPETPGGVAGDGATGQDLTRLREELSGAAAKIASSDAELGMLQRRCDAFAQETAAMRRELDQIKHRTAAAGAGLPAVAPVAIPALLANAEGLSDSEARERSTFRTIHRNVRQELADAKRKMVRQIPPVVAPEAWSIRQWRQPPVPAYLFDAEWIRSRNPQLSGVSRARYRRSRSLWHVDPHPLFDAAAYRANGCFLFGREVSPLRHYLTAGWREGRDPHPWFANDWYLWRNPDVRADGNISPLQHYLLYGWREGRRPNPVFDPALYLDRYPDVRDAGVEPLTHYLAFGQAEGRDCPIPGVGERARRWIPAALRDRGILDYLLHGEPVIDAPQIDLAALLSELRAQPSVAPSAGAPAPARQILPPLALPESWPPPPLKNYWLPQTTRDFLLPVYGDAFLEGVRYLYSVMAAFEETADAFPSSDAASMLVGHARALAEQVAKATSGEPDVSIIIPVYNNILDTILCVVSVLNASSRFSYEIIVADDCSTDATATLIPAIGGCVRHVRHAKNHGFLGNCNEAARSARGRYVVLLNNDTIVLPGWLDALVTPFERMERVGLVGAKLINWDGTLQEAGGIFWRDGSAWNFGRGQRPRAPEFSYLKDVDYCSGAAIALPMTVWREMGGFDPLYSPAYCEDSDLAFRLRDAGYRTLMNPAAEVIHHEGRSHGRDLASGIKAYQVQNQERLFERWRSVLERDHYPNAHEVLRARDRSSGKRHILLVDHYVPQEDQDAGSRTIYQYINTLLEDDCIVTFWPDNLWRDPEYTPRLQALGVEVIYGPEFRDGFDAFLQARADLYDAVFLSRPHIATNYIDSIRQHTTAPILYYGHDLHFKRMEAAKALGQETDQRAIDAMRDLEFRVCRGSDVIFYPAPEEVDFVRNAIGGKREFIANPVFLFDRDQVEQSRKRLATFSMQGAPRLLFVGGFNHTPNREGILWFVQEVLPLVRARRPDVVLDVVGSKPPAEVLDLASPGVNVLGFVSDERLMRLYAEATIAVAPLRFGAGVKGKVIEAMAMGVPVATTPTGAQGIEAPDRHLFVGETAEQLAEAVLLALSDRRQAMLRADAALDFILRHYSKAALQSLFRRLMPRRH